MVNKYFVNCRGATFNKVHADEWDKSGGLPRLSSPFLPISENFNEDYMIFTGSTKASNWLHWDSVEASTQIDYLKSIGVNLIRVYGDMHSWGSLGSRYLTAVDSLASLCNSKKMYIQWVLFDGYTQDDSSSDTHSLGYFDPSTPYEAMSWGIKRWQRCPNVQEISTSGEYDYYNVWPDMPSRNLSSLEASGNSYIFDMISTAGKYKSALAWEVMHDVNVLSSESEGYDFLVGAISKVNELKSSRQKTTFSAKYLNAFDTLVGSDYPDVYVSGIVELAVPLVDYVCELTTNFTSLGFINSYVRLLDFSEKTGKPFFLIDSFNDSLVTPNDLFTFAKDFNVGAIYEGMVDRSLSRKPFNDLKGVIYDDGSCRRQIDVSAINSKAVNDGIGSSKISLLSEKAEFSTLSSLEASSFERFAQHGDVGLWVWSSIYTALSSYPEYSAIPIGYLPMASSVSSTHGGWLTVGDEYPYDINNLFDSLSSLRSSILDNPLAGIGDSVTRDKLGYKNLTKLIKLTLDLDMHIGHNYYNVSPYSSSSFIASEYQETLNSYASSFLPTSITKTSEYNASPFIGTPRLFSNLSPSDGAYRESVLNFDKPLCYWNRPTVYTSGCCLYSTAIDVDVMDTSYTDIVGSYIDWASYDTLFDNWSESLYNAYVDLNNNLKTHLSTFTDTTIQNYLSTESYI